MRSALEAKQAPCQALASAKSLFLNTLFFSSRAMMAADSVRGQNGRTPDAPSPPLESAWPSICKGTLVVARCYTASAMPRVLWGECYAAGSNVGPSDCATASRNPISSNAGMSMQAAAIISAWSIVISVTAKHVTTCPSLATKRAVQVSSSYAREDTASPFRRTLASTSLFGIVDKNLAIAAASSSRAVAQEMVVLMLRL